MDAEVPAVVEGAFEVIAYRVRRDGRPNPAGHWLRHVAGRHALVCKECGPLPDAVMPGWTSDWHLLCGDAIDHVKETGHQVAVESWHGAVYGLDEDGAVNEAAPGPQPRED